MRKLMSSKFGQWMVILTLSAFYAGCAVTQAVFNRAAYTEMKMKPVLLGLSKLSDQKVLFKAKYASYVPTSGFPLLYLAPPDAPKMPMGYEGQMVFNCFEGSVKEDLVSITEGSVINVYGTVKRPAYGGFQNTVCIEKIEASK